LTPPHDAASHDSQDARSAPVFVTGATGYVGGRLVPRLLDAGHPVRCYARSPRKLDLRPGDMVEVAVLDGRRRMLRVPLAGTVRETMAPDLSSVQTSSAGAWSVVPGTECPTVRPCPAWATHSDRTACWVYMGVNTMCRGTDLILAPVRWVFDRTNGAENYYIHLDDEGVSVEQANSPECGGTPGCWAGNCDASGNSASDSSNGDF
jgi:hypothetical protein